MPAAAQAAVDGNFAIECDIQLSSDGEAMVTLTDPSQPADLGSASGIVTVPCTDPREATGINTPDDLREVADWLRTR